MVGPAAAINNPPPEFENTVSENYEYNELLDRRFFMEKLKTNPIYRDGLHVARSLDQSYHDESIYKRDDQEVVTRSLCKAYFHTNLLFVFSFCLTAQNPGVSQELPCAFVSEA